jgi:hypothetical protein
MYHNNSAANITAATLVTGELQVPFLPLLGYKLTQPPTQKLSNTSGIYDLWTDGREDTFSEETSISRYLGNLPCCLGSG